MATADILAAFAALPEREALILLEQLAHRFSYSRGHDGIHAAVREIAADAAEEEGFRAPRHAMNERAELADAYLTAPRRFGPSFEIAA